MKKILLISLVVLALVLTFSQVSLGVSVKGALYPSIVINEMSVASGTATVDLQRGIGTITVKNMPREYWNVSCFPVLLTDESTLPATKEAAGAYRAWLVKVDVVPMHDQYGDYEMYMANGGFYLGTLSMKPTVTVWGKMCSGSLTFNAKKDLSKEGYNLLVITAEEASEYRAAVAPIWSPEPLWQTMTWDSENSVMVLWGEIGKGLP